MRQFYFGLGYLLRSFFFFGGWIEGNANEFSLDIWAFCRPKTPPTRLGGVSYHWAVGPDGAWAARRARPHPPQRHLAVALARGAAPRDRARRRRGGGGDPAGLGERSGGPPHAGPVVLDDDDLGVDDPGQH